MTNEHTGEEYLGKDRDELRAIIIERDIEIERLQSESDAWSKLSLVQLSQTNKQLRGNLSLAEEGLANAMLEIERLREVVTIPLITPEAPPGVRLRVLAEHEKGQPVNAQDLINALMWRVGNQRKEIARLSAKRAQPVEPSDGPDIQHEKGCGFYSAFREADCTCGMSSAEKSSAFDPDTIPECRCGVQHYPPCSEKPIENVVRDPGWRADQERKAAAVKSTAHAPEVCGCPYGKCTCDDGSGLRT